MEKKLKQEIAPELIQEAQIDQEFIESGCTCCHAKTKKREEKEYKDLYNRLNRIEGQVRGIKRMLEEDCYCVDILTQVSAIASALKGFECELLSNHIKTCVAENLKAGNDEVADELVNVMRKLMK